MIKLTSLVTLKSFLEKKKKDLEHRIRGLSQDDPFADKTRLQDNAASDTEAREEIGHEQVETLRQELVREVTFVKRALRKIGIGKYGICENCGKDIDKARLDVFPQAASCINCEQKKEKH